MLFSWSLEEYLRQVSTAGTLKCASSVENAYLPTNNTYLLEINAIFARKSAFKTLFT
jgi:hypothetical protein